MWVDEPDDVAFGLEMAVGAKCRQRPGDYLSNCADVVGEFLYQQTRRRPMVLPVVMEV